jgi:hypothetical protein
MTAEDRHWESMERYPEYREHVQNVARVARMTFSNRQDDLNSIKQAVEQMEALLRVRAELVRTGSDAEITNKISFIIAELVRSLPSTIEIP